MPSPFSNTPIRLKLIFLFSIILLLFSTFNFFYYPKVHEKQASSYIKTHLQNMAESVALATGISLRYMDFSNIALAMEWAKNDSNLIYLGIFDSDNDEMGIFNPKKHQFNTVKYLNRGGYFEIDENIFTVVPITDGKTHQGNVVIGLSLIELKASIHNNRLITLYVSSTILLAGILIAIFFSNRISKPLARLTEATREVGTGKYSMEIDVQSSDEVGVLARAFQIMTEKINQTMAENSSINKQLEEIIDDLTELGTTLSAEKDFASLLDMVISNARHLTHADAGTLYLVEGDKLIYSIVHNATLDIYLGTQKEDEIPFAPLAIDGPSVSGYVARNKTFLKISDVYSSDEFDFIGTKTFDQKTGYHTKSMMVIPLLNLENETVGVIQLINSKDPETGEVGPFPASVENLVKSLASQAAVAIANMLLRKETENLLNEVTSIKNYNENILESMSNGVITFDSHKRMIKCNSASLRLLNAGTEELVCPVMECFSDKDSWLMKSIDRVLETGKLDTIPDKTVQITEGNSIFANITISPLRDTRKELIGAMVIFEDITMEKRVKGTLTKFMTKEVAEKLLEGEENLLGGQLQEAAVLFSDIRNFTAIAESLSPKDTVEFLNEYFDIMVELVFDNGGVLDKFIGDSLLAVYGVPFKGQQDSENSVRTAVQMVQALKKLNQFRMANNKSPFNIGIGINTSEVLAGNIGSMKRMDYTIIGDGVNLASRLEGANKYFGTNILISRNTYLIIKNIFPCREIDLIRVKGKGDSVSVYEVLDFDDVESCGQTDKSMKTFQEGLNFYRDRKWEKGINKFYKTLEINANDNVSRIYVDRCKLMIETPPNKNWDAVWVMDTK